MPKNIVIYSDGTGQDGGVRPDQRLSNIYKMYRASRVGPDNDVDPDEQVVFYDAGLGTDADARGLTALRRTVAKLLSSATGRGITTNIADCYEFIINHYRPGDRIWLFGFSRGAYTARCIANVLMLCGVPTRTPEGPLPRFRTRVREIAERAVIRVYEHGAGHPRGRYEGEREELARRFRQDFGSGDDISSNAAPYFIGVFDTVASLGAKGPFRWALVGMFVLLIAIAAALGAGSLVALFGMGWTPAAGVSLAVAAAIAAWSYLRTALKVMRPVPPGSRMPWFPRMHLAQWSGSNFDRLLSRSVVYARHAIAIDENRADFPRLPWGWGKGVERPVKEEGGVEPFVQMWFAGNHSDIGGSYPETESRLSDTALGWMVDEARSIPHPLKLNDRRLALFPSAAGMQHDEVAGMADTIRRRTPWGLRWFTRGWSWPVRLREPIAEATMHPSVAERFALEPVDRQGGEGPYRPEALRHHISFAHLYQEGS